MPVLPPFDTSNRLAIGADLFVIGYPGEEEAFPQPTISRGILSRYRLWPDQGATYLQTDASIDGVQSRGVLAAIVDGADYSLAEADENELARSRSPPRSTVPRRSTSTTTCSR